MASIFASKIDVISTPYIPEPKNTSLYHNRRADIFFVAKIDIVSAAVVITDGIRRFNFHPTLKIMRSLKMYIKNDLYEIKNPFERSRSSGPYVYEIIQIKSDEVEPFFFFF